MARPGIRPTGRESAFGTEEIIVSKTDLAGRIIYANEVFLRVSGFRSDDVIGAPHNIIRHPDMPHAVFKMLWDRIKGGREIFAYIVNMASNGDHYWVFAHVTPSFDAKGNLTGYHSNRRKPEPGQIAAIRPVYATLRREEAGADRIKDGIAKAERAFDHILSTKGMTYDEFVFSL